MAQRRPSRGGDASPRQQICQPDTSAGGHLSIGFVLAHRVRFICGTQTIHTELEGALASFLGTDDAILYTSCFDANGGLFETLLAEGDVVLSDELNHASIIDGIRLCRAERHRYAHADMAELERLLVATRGARTRLVVTDGVFSMDGDLAPLADICAGRSPRCAGHGGRQSRDRGPRRQRPRDVRALGRGRPRGRRHLDARQGARWSQRWLHGDAARDRRAAAPALVAASLLQHPAAGARVRLAGRPADAGAVVGAARSAAANTRWFREAMTAAGFAIRPGPHPIVPIMLGDARLAQQMAADLFGAGIYVVGFSYPVVPRGAARIRVQISAAHEPAHLERAVAAFMQVGRAHRLI
jgi:glycine C-acetyltransferase